MYRRKTYKHREKMATDEPRRETPEKINPANLASELRLPKYEKINFSHLINTICDILF